MNYHIFKSKLFAGFLFSVVAMGSLIGYLNLANNSPSSQTMAYTPPQTINVSIDPKGPIQLAANQIQVFTANTNVENSSVNYLWSIDNSSADKTAVNGTDYLLLANGNQAVFKFLGHKLEFCWLIIAASTGGNSDNTTATIQCIAQPPTKSTDEPTTSMQGKQQTQAPSQNYYTTNLYNNIPSTASYIVKTDGFGQYQVINGTDGTIMTSYTSTSASQTLNNALALGGLIAIRKGDYTGAELIVPSNAYMIAETGTTGIKYTQIENGARIDEPAFNAAFGGYSSGKYTISTNATSIVTPTTWYLAFKPDNTIYFVSGDAAYTINNAQGSGSLKALRGLYAFSSTINFNFSTGNYDFRDAVFTYDGSNYAFNVSADFIQLELGHTILATQAPIGIIYVTNANNAKINALYLDGNGSQSRQIGIEMMATGSFNHIYGASVTVLDARRLDTIVNIETVGGTASYTNDITVDIHEVGGDIGKALYINPYSRYIHMSISSDNGQVIIEGSMCDTIRQMYLETSNLGLKITGSYNKILLDYEGAGIPVSNSGLYNSIWTTRTGYYGTNSTGDGEDRLTFVSSPITINPGATLKSIDSVNGGYTAFWDGTNLQPALMKLTYNFQGNEQGSGKGIAVYDPTYGTILMTALTNGTSPACGTTAWIPAPYISTQHQLELLAIGSSPTEQLTIRYVYLERSW